MCLWEGWQASKCLLKETDCSVLEKKKGWHNPMLLFLSFRCCKCGKSNCFGLHSSRSTHHFGHSTKFSRDGRSFWMSSLSLSCICSQVAVNDASPLQQLIPIQLIGDIGCFLSWLFSHQPFCNHIKSLFSEPNL